MDLRNEPPAPVALEDSLNSWLAGGGGSAAAASRLAVRIPLLLAVAIFALAVLASAWPWLSGAVTIPWDAKSQFYPEVQFLASSIARGAWPWWTPNVFAGWPRSSHPHSLMFSPL